MALRGGEQCATSACPRVASALTYRVAGGNRHAGVVARASHAGCGGCSWSRIAGGGGLLGAAGDHHLFAGNQFFVDTGDRFRPG